MNVSERRFKYQAGFFLLAALVSLMVLVAFPRLSFPLGSAFVISMTIKPWVRWYKRETLQRKIIWSILSALLLLASLFPFVNLLSTLGSELSRVRTYLPSLEHQLRSKFELLKNFLWQNFNFRLEADPLEWLLSSFGQGGGTLLSNLPALMSHILEWMILTPVFVWFFFSQGNQLRQQALGLIPNRWFERSYMLLHTFQGRFTGYIFAKTLEATILGSLIFLGLWAINFPFAFLLSFIGGLTNIIPYVGPLLGWGAALAVALVQSSSTEGLWLMSLVFLAANLIDMVLVFPLLVSRIVNLHPLLVIASVIVGSEVGGLMGMIVSVPVTTFLVLLVAEVYKSFYVEMIK